MVYRLSGVVRAIVGIGVVILFAACSPAQPPTSRDPGSRFIIPEAGEGIALSQAVQTPIAIRERPGVQNLKVTLSSDFLVSQVIDVNLDIDQMDEQIVVFKRRDDPEDRIRLLVVDFDTVRNTYVPTWEGVTRANNLRTFVVSTLDVTGDHTLEIVVMGMNNAGNQTLDVFRQVPAPTGFGLFYQNIASKESDASIEIEEIDRPVAYTSMQSTGPAFPIHVYRRNQETENPLDLIKATYQWRPSEGRFLLVMEEEIPGVRTAEAQLRALYEGNNEEFERFLTGPWYRATAGARGMGGELAYFDPRLRRVTFFRGDSQESYHWLNSHKTIYRSGPGLWINLHSEAVDTVRKQAAVSVTSIDTLVVTIDGNDVWNGTYRRLTPSLQRAMVTAAAQGPRVAHLPLSGLYRNESGTEILFSSPRFTFREGGAERTGGFALYHADQYVLDMKFLDPNGLVTESRVFRVEHSEQIQDDRVIRTLKLTPARIRSSGVETTSTRTITLEQIEEIRADTGA